MKHSMYFLVGALLLSLCACVTALKPTSVGVEVSDQASEECKNLGAVYGDSTWGGGVSSENAMKNQVAERGGNFLVIITDETGIAYLCPMPGGDMQMAE